MFADLRFQPKRVAPTSDSDSWLQIRTLISDLEKVASFNILLYLNSLLFCILYLPLLALTRLPKLGPDALRFSLLCVGCLALFGAANEGRLYHDLKEQDFIKLSAFYTILMVSNVLLRILGKRLLLNLLQSNRGEGASNWIMAAAYVVMHTAVLYCQLIVIFVSLHSSLATSALLFFSTFFFRLKSFVFKKLDRRLLFNLLCQDTCERLEFSICLLLLCLKAALEGHENYKEVWLMSCYLLGLWLFVDWTKYYFITYLNRIPDSTFILDLYIKLQKQNLRNAVETGMYIDYWSESKTEVILDPYNSLTLSYHFPTIPLACVVIVVIGPALKASVGPGDCGLCALTLLLVKCGVMKTINYLISRCLFPLTQARILIR